MTPDAREPDNNITAAPPTIADHGNLDRYRDGAPHEARETRRACAEEAAVVLGADGCRGKCAVVLGQFHEVVQVRLGNMLEKRRAAWAPAAAMRASHPLPALPADSAALSGAKARAGPTVGMLRRKPCAATTSCFKLTTVSRALRTSTSARKKTAHAPHPRPRACSAVSGKQPRGRALAVGVPPTEKRIAVGEEAIPQREDHLPIASRHKEPADLAGNTRVRAHRGWREAVPMRRDRGMGSSTAQAEKAVKFNVRTDPNAKEGSQRKPHRVKSGAELGVMVEKQEAEDVKAWAASHGG